MTQAYPRAQASRLQVAVPPEAVLISCPHSVSWRGRPGWHESAWEGGGREGGVPHAWPVWQRSRPSSAQLPVHSLLTPGGLGGAQHLRHAVLVVYPARKGHPPLLEGVNLQSRLRHGQAGDGRREAVQRRSERRRTAVVSGRG